MTAEIRESKPAALASVANGLSAELEIKRANFRMVCLMTLLAMVAGGLGIGTGMFLSTRSLRHPCDEGFCRAHSEWFQCDVPHCVDDYNCGC
jgi:hypothetical protein